MTTTLRCVWPNCGVHVNPARGGRVFDRGDGSQYGACCSHASIVVIGRTVLGEAANYAVQRVQQQHPGFVEALQDAAARCASFYEPETSPPQAELDEAPGPDRDIVDVEFTEVK